MRRLDSLASHLDRLKRVSYFSFDELFENLSLSADLAAFGERTPKLAFSRSVPERKAQAHAEPERAKVIAEGVGKALTITAKQEARQSSGRSNHKRWQAGEPGQKVYLLHQQVGGRSERAPGAGDLRACQSDRGIGRNQIYRRLCLVGKEPCIDLVDLLLHVVLRELLPVRERRC